MNQIVTRGIILARTDYGEADRIITLLTPDKGKLRLIAKGVRKLKSKLAGGIELFSTSEIAYMPGRGEIGTLVSTRLIRHYGRIVTNVSHTMLGYDLISRLHKATEDEPEAEYYELLEEAFGALDDVSLEVELIRLWFSSQLLQLAGHAPNLQTAADGTKLQSDLVYEFSFDDSAFIARPGANFRADDIKFLRLVFAGNTPQNLQKVAGAAQLVEQSRKLIDVLARQYRS